MGVCHVDKKMGNILYRKGVLILPTVANSCCFFPFWSFPLSSPFSCFSFSQSFKITTALLMYLEDDYPLRLGFCSWTRPGEPHHPRCNRQEQKECRGKERREARIPLSYNKENSQIFTTTTPTPPIPAHHLHQPFNLLGVKIARSSSYPGREIFWGILIIVSLQLSLIQTTRSLMRSFISTSQLLCYSLALDVLPPPQATRPPTPT